MSTMGFVAYQAFGEVQEDTPEWSTLSRLEQLAWENVALAIALTEIEERGSTTPIPHNPHCPICNNVKSDPDDERRNSELGL